VSERQEDAIMAIGYGASGLMRGEAFVFVHAICLLLVIDSSLHPCLFVDKMLVAPQHTGDEHSCDCY